jgi:hypothetical protein
MLEAIRVACEGVDLIDFAELVPLQGDLKSLSKENYERLKRVILELGFSSPFHVWFSHDGKKYILDGTQRYRALTKMRLEGHEVPPLPYVKVDAVSKKDAMRKLLTIASQYGKVEGQGLYEFMTEAEMDVNELILNNSFPDINLEHFSAEYFDGWSSDAHTKEVDKVEANLDGITSTIKISCPQEKKDEIIEFLKMNLKDEDVVIS